jgi:hypothetical protein
VTLVYVADFSKMARTLDGQRKETFEMKESELRRSLETLHRELERVECVDESSKALLEELMGEIGEILERSEEAPSDRHAGLLEKLRSSTDSLEAAHPDLTAVLQRAIDALANMGI